VQIRLGHYKDGDQLGEMQTDAWQALKEKNIEVN
jgi:hypothetical protein